MNFQRLWENMQLGKEPDQPIDGAVDSVIRTGLGVSDTFWDDLVSVMNNSEGLAALLDVTEDQLSTWRPRIEKALASVKASDESEDVKKNKKLMKTGIPSID